MLGCGALGRVPAGSAQPLGCAGQGGAGRGEWVWMETCRPPAEDVLHKQEICQSWEKCEGRSRQHVMDSAET